MVRGGAWGWQGHAGGRGIEKLQQDLKGLTKLDTKAKKPDAKAKVARLPTHTHSRRNTREHQS